MKKIYFFLLIFVIQFCLFAQHTNNLPPKVLTKSEDILKAIVQSHNQKNENDSERTIVSTQILENGYVLESRMGQFWSGTDWENSSMNLFTYTPEGLKTEEISQFWVEGEWENSYRYLTSYFLNDIVSLYVEQAWNGSEWVNSYEYASSYNVDLQLTEYDVQQWNGAAWDSLYKTTYLYDNTGNLESSTDQTWNGTGWNNQYKYSYQYNANNDVSEKLEEQWIEGSWKNSILDVYTYNSQNQLELIASFWWADSVWKESVEIYYAYDSYGNVIDELTKFWESEELGLQNKYHKTYEYLPGTSIVTKVENQEWNLQLEEWVNQWREIKTYDVENILQNYLTEVWDGSTWQSSSQENYTYDEHGNLDILISQNWSGTEWINSFKASHVWLLVTSVESEEPASIPFAYSLEQNYPNPFNPGTRISFSLPFDADVSLIIYDILGNEITRLIDGNLRAGAHEVQMNANQLSSGVYFYRLNAFNSENKTSFSSVKKMTLLK